MFKDFSPANLSVESTQVRDEFVTEYLEGGWFSDTIGSYQSQDLTSSGSGETMKFESVFSISMSYFFWHIFR